MLRAQLPYSRNVAKRNSWAGYHINILASDDRTATESFSMRESKFTFKKTLEGRGIYPSFFTLFVRGLSLSCFCTYSDALYQLFEAGVRGWQVSRASTFCLTGNLRRPRSDELITVLLAAGRQRLSRLFLEPDSGLASLTRFCTKNILTISKSARQVLSKGFW